MRKEGEGIQVIAWMQGSGWDCMIECWFSAEDQARKERLFTHAKIHVLMGEYT